MRKKLFLNTVSSLTNEIAALVMSFILPRLILVYYGSDINGLVTSVTQFLSFISLCELGIGPVIKANLYKPLANKDEHSISCIVKSSQKFFRNIALILVVYTIILASFYPRIVSKDFDFLFTASLVLIISISSFAQYYFGMTNQLLLAANQQAYIQLFITSGSLVLNTVLCILLMRAGASIHTVKLTTSLLYAARPICLSIYVHKHFNINKKVTYKEEPIKQKWNGFAQHVATMAQDNTDTVVLTLFSTLSNVSIYGVYHLVVNGIRQLVNTVFTGMTPLIGALIAQDDKERLNKTFNMFEWTIHTLTTIIFTITGLLLLPFVMLYTSGVTDADYFVPAFGILITICGGLRCLQMIYNTVIHSAGHFRETQVASILEPIINISISVVSVWKWGLIGVAIGTIVSLSYRLIYMIFYLHYNVLYHSFKAVIKQFTVDAISVFAIIIATWFCPKFASNYLNWTVNAIFICIISAVTILIMNFIFYRRNVIELFSWIKQWFFNRKTG